MHPTTLQIEKRVQDIIHSVIDIIKQNLDEDESFELYLFGSRVHENAAPHSDIDLALAASTLSERSFLNIKRAVDDIRTLYSIDLIHLQRVDPDFKNIILFEAIKIYG